MEQPQNVVVASGDPDVVELLEAMFGVDPRFSIVGAAPLVGALDVVRAARPDVVVLDAGHAPVPTAVVAACRDAAPGATIVVLSEVADPYTLLAVLGDGADALLDLGRAWAELVPTVLGLRYVASR
jgi:DNA-binding NarL/FixJ family response regulator